MMTRRTRGPPLDARLSTVSLSPPGGRRPGLGLAQPLQSPRRARCAGPFSARQRTQCDAAGDGGPLSSPADSEMRRGTHACAGRRLALYSWRTNITAMRDGRVFWLPLSHAAAESSDGSSGM